jgi:outer membrane lipoprotein-sorting protein
MGNLSFILFALVLASFVGGCVWRMAWRRPEERAGRGVGDRGAHQGDAET